MRQYILLVFSEIFSRGYFNQAFVGLPESSNLGEDALIYKVQSACCSCLLYICISYYPPKLSQHPHTHVHCIN